MKHLLIISVPLLAVAFTHTPDLRRLMMARNVAASGEQIYTPSFGNGNTVFAPGPLDSSHYGMLRFTNTLEGLVEDSGGVDGSHYAVFGLGVTNQIIDTVMAHDSSYSTSTNAQFPFGYQHMGPAMRFVDNLNFAGMATISVTATQLQVIDRVGGTEYPQLFHVPALAYGSQFRVRVENTNANDCNVFLWNSSGGLLTNLSYTFTAGVSNAGRAALHSYDCAGRYISMSVSNLSQQIVGTSGPFFHSLQTLQRYSTMATNGVMTMHSDGSLSGLNDWKVIVGSNSWTSFNMGGTLSLRSGRLLGVALRQNNLGSGLFAAYDDNNSVLRIYAGDPKGTLNTVASSGAVTLTDGTDYRFRLSVTNATNFTFTCNGATVTFNTNGHPSGNLGFVGLQSAANFHTVTVTNLN